MLIKASDPPPVSKYAELDSSFIHSTCVLIKFLRIWVELIRLVGKKTKPTNSSQNMIPCLVQSKLPVSPHWRNVPVLSPPTLLSGSDHNLWPRPTLWGAAPVFRMTLIFLPQHLVLFVVSNREFSLEWKSKPRNDTIKILIQDSWER